MTLADRCREAHLADLRADGSRLPRPLAECLAECLATGQRDVYLRARREAGRQFVEERLAAGDREYQRRHQR